jgi:hypothetical protein
METAITSSFYIRERKSRLPGATGQPLLPDWYEFTSEQIFQAAVECRIVILSGAKDLLFLSPAQSYQSC